ncbi:MAG TPA: glycosyltransferase family 1 protein [Pantanalinema sp.]
MGRYIQCLLPRLGAQGVEVIAWMLPHQAADPRWDFPGIERRVLEAKPMSPQEQAMMPAAVKEAGLDLLHVPHLNAPLLSRVPLVATIHDLIPFHYPEAIAARFGGAYFHAMARLVPRKARRVLTVSEHTRKDLVTLAGAKPEKVETIPLGVEARFTEQASPELRRRVRDRYGLTGRYLLYAGQWKGYKNVDLLLDVMEGMDSERFADVKLVLVGREDPRVPMRERLAARNLSDRVVLTGFVAEEAELAALYQEATAFVFPSRYEGFGLPPLEAMAAGVPVIASDRASIPEVVGPAGLLLAPDGVLEWQRAIESLCEDPGRREALAALGRERARAFSWDVTAARTLEAYRRILSPHP